MSKAEERALSAYDTNTPAPIRIAYRDGYEQSERDTIVEVEKWLKANFHHRNCWNADEFCISLRTYFGIEK